MKAFLLESPDAYDMRTIEVVVPPYFIFAPAAIWVYMIIIAVAMLYGMWWYQERLRKQHEGEQAENQESSETEASKQSSEAPQEQAEEEEATDEYEIIEN